MSIFARSPFIVTIAESGQEGSKVELRIWNGTGSAPTDPQYTLSKLIPASNNVNTYYNISPYIREYLNFDERQTNWNNNTTTPTAQWCNVQVKRYKLDGTTYTLLDTTTYKAFDGFGYYEQGYNPTISYDILHDEGTFFYAYNANENPSTNTDYRSNFITVATTTTAVSARWTNLNSGATQVQSISNNQVIDVRKVHQSYYADGNKLEIFYVGSGVVLYTGYFKPYLNCKYTPIVCDFVNKYGGWQRTWFFGASNDTLSVEKTDYNLMQGDFPDYDTLVGQRKSFNVNGKKTIKVNTDWVREDFKEIVKQLMLSERILLNSLPVKLNTQSTELFKNINTKMINYQMEFEFAYNAINNVI
jgi:hypothetical protein